MCAGYTGSFAAERVSVLPSTTNAKAPVSNVFQLKGSSDKFILLDSTEEGYFVLAQKCCATRPYSADGNPVAFDPENTNSIAYWLNHDYLTDTSYAKRLPQAIIDNLVKRVYTTEGGGSHVPFRTEYKVTCKIVLLSQTEWSKYNAKFGYADDTSVSYWILRTVREMNGSPLVAGVSGANAGLTFDGKWTSSVGMRPAFYLSKDFFEKVSLDMDNTGDTIKSILRKEHDVTELQQVYTANEITSLTQTDIAPVAESVTITGRGIVGEVITGKYSFVSLDDNSENGTMIQWQKSIDGKENWSTILGAESVTYVPTQNDVGYYLRMKVSPMTGTMAGSSYVSVPLNCKVREISKPVASNVFIVNTKAPKSGTILDVKYSFYDENRDMCSETEYIWESSSDKNISERIGNARYLKLTNNEGGKYVRVGVIPKKQTNSADGRHTIEGDVVYSDWTEVENLPAADDVKIIRNLDTTVTVSKTDEGVSITSMLVPSKKIEKLTAEYYVDKNSDYTVVCEWQGADNEDGQYLSLSSGKDTLEFVPEKTMWVRAKVYTKNSTGVGKAVYSEPVFVGEAKAKESKGELSATQSLTADKTYEIWISNDTNYNSYAYSFKIDGVDVTDMLSDKYLTKVINQAGGAYVIGTLVSDIYSSDAFFKAGEIVPKKDTKMTVSDVLTTAVGGSVTQAKVFVIEK